MPWAWAASSPRAAGMTQWRARETGRGPLLGDAVEVAAFDEIHGEEVDAAVFAGVEGGDDVGVVNASGEGEFAVEAADGVGVAAEGGGEDLHGDELAGRRWRALRTTPMPPRRGRG